MAIAKRFTFTQLQKTRMVIAKLFALTQTQTQKKKKKKLPNFLCYKLGANLFNRLTINVLHYIYKQVS